LVAIEYEKQNFDSEMKVCTVASEQHWFIHPVRLHRCIKTTKPYLNESIFKFLIESILSVCFYLVFLSSFRKESKDTTTIDITKSRTAKIKRKTCLATHFIRTGCGWSTLPFVKQHWFTIFFNPSQPHFVFHLGL
jgi:hypothetical protein